jgi:hypothetical protein
MSSKLGNPDQLHSLKDTSAIEGFIEFAIVWYVMIEVKGFDRK